MKCVTLKRTETRIIELRDDCPTDDSLEIIHWMKIRNDSDGFVKSTWGAKIVEQSVTPWRVVSVESVPFTHRWRRKLKHRYHETITSIKEAVTK